MQEENLDLKLVLHIIQPIFVIILNNRVFKFERVIMDILYPDKFLSCLHQLYNHPTKQEKLPPELKKHFEYEPLQVNYGCVIGADEPEYYKTHKCLDFNLEFSNTNKEEVILTDLAFKKEPLNEIIRIKTIDLFYVLSNLCVEYVSKMDLTHGKLEKSEYRKPLPYTPITVSIAYNYAVDYLKYIRRRIRKHYLSPEDVLLNGGFNTLVHLRDEERIANYIEVSRTKIKDIHTKIVEKEIIPSNKELLYTILFRCYNYGTTYP